MFLANGVVLLNLEFAQEVGIYETIDSGIVGRQRGASGG